MFQAGWQCTALTYSFPYLKPVCCSMSSSNWCFLTCIQVSQEAGQVVWYSHLYKNFPQFVVIHTVKGFGIVNKAEIDVFLELSCFFNEPIDIGNLTYRFSDFYKFMWHWSGSCERLERLWGNTLGPRAEKPRQDGRHWNSSFTVLEQL